MVIVASSPMVCRRCGVCSSSVVQRPGDGMTAAYKVIT
jgi:hypothetical protein